MELGTDTQHEKLDYRIYPAYPAKGKVFSGYESLAQELLNHESYILDGYAGVDWQEVIESLSHIFHKSGKVVSFIPVSYALKNEEEIEKLAMPFIGGDDPIFGYRTNLTLSDFFNAEKLSGLDQNFQADLSIIYGFGAALSSWDDAPIGYIDLPKSVLQYRMRKGEANNLGSSKSQDPKQIYKRFYFLDWIVLNAHKKKLLSRLTLVIDQQHPGNPVWTSGDVLRATLQEMSTSYFRVKPWFEPGVWGGDWLKQRISGLNQDVPNYAWSFEMIVPENGILLEQGGNKLEVSFDQLMYQASTNVLGKAAKRFGDDFPIRFDFLDTFNGGNLSIQCHPKTAYIQEEFGEPFTQDETYYMVESSADAVVYLGFQDDINPDEFKAALVDSYTDNKVLDIERYVQKLPARKHDLFLIPNGTPHCSGIDNLVLEISATPYIYTFKMYDWLRPDLDGNLRPLNIDRAFDNLDFSLKGKVVEQTLISSPQFIPMGEGAQKVYMPTHEKHFYDICRYEFNDQITIETAGQCHLLMLVEGDAIELITQNGHQETFYYIETFAVPAGAVSYKLTNKGSRPAKVIVSYVKEAAC